MNDKHTNKRTETHACDYISRQAAIDILYDFAGCIVDTPNGDYHKAYKAYRHRLEILPSAQPQRPKGHWIFDFAHNEMTCSECGRTFDGGFDLDNADNFCRHCGSDNRGEQDG